MSVAPQLVNIDNTMSVNNCTVATDKCIQDLHPTLQKTLKEIIKKEGYVTHAIEQRNFNVGGNNFLADLIEIDITGKTINGEKQMSIFIKKKKILEKLKIISVPELYVREVFLYTEFSNVINFLQDNANVPKEDRYKVVKAYDGTNTDILILENLSKRGFKMYDRLHIPPLKYLELAVEEIAKFHAISFVVEHNMPEFYQNKVKPIDSPYKIFDDVYEGYFTNVFTNAASLFDDEETKRKIENFLPIAIKKMPQYERDQTSVRCCLTHGDYRMNNILLREINGEPVEIIAVDYQFLHYGCPLKDFLFLIYSCTHRDFRTKHLNNLKDLYFGTLSRFLQYFNMDVEAVYPREEFDKDYKVWMEYGLIRVLYSSLFLFPPDTGVDTGTTPLSELTFTPAKEYEVIASGWIEEFIELGYL